MIGRNAAAHRHLKIRVLEALEQRLKQFRTREELWPLRVPREPVSLDEVVQQTLPDEHRAFDVAALRSRTLLHLEWPDGSIWDLWVIVLPSNLKLYCDTSEEESRVLASGGRNEGDASDRLFLELLADSGGEHFGIEMAGGAPSRVRSSIADRIFLIDFFVNLFEVTGTEDSVRADLAERTPDRPDAVDARGADFRADVERWMEEVGK